MTDNEMRKHALRRYVVFRVKAIEFLDIAALRQSLLSKLLFPPTPVNRLPGDFADSLRTVHLSWFALFIDKSKDGMDALKLWKELFPMHATRIDTAWRTMEPGWEILRKFRDRAGFHGDKPLRFFGARTEILKQLEIVKAAVEEFERLFKFLLKAEPIELPDLEAALDSLLDDLERQHGYRYKRQEFKRYLMIPSTRRAAGP